jgi:hypothetical protein
MPENGYRKSYGVVTAAFAVTILGCYIFRVILVNLNKKIDAGEAAWETRRDVAEHTAQVEGVTVEEGRHLNKGYRYLV